MKVPLLLLACVALTVAFLPATLRAEPTEAELRGLAETLERSTLPEIVGRFGVGAATPWPHIPTAYEAREASPETQRRVQAAARLGLVLLGRLKATFDPERRSAGDDLPGEVAGYFSLETTLREAGGYHNLVLADTVAELAFYRLSGALVEDGPEQVAAVERILARRPPRPFDLRGNLNTLAAQDPFLDRHRGNLGDVRGDESFVVLAMLLTRDDPDGPATLEAATGRGLGSRTLLEQPSAVGLILRMATSATALDCLLPGMIEFLKAGGSADELAGDPRSLRQRLGKRLYTYRMPFFDMKGLDSDRLRSVVELHRDPATRGQFLRDFLE